MKENPLAALPFAPLPAQTVARFLPMTFLENLYIDDDGGAVITSQLDGRVWSVPFGGKPKQLAQVPGRAVAVAPGPDGQPLVFASDLNGVMCVFGVGPDGECERLLDVPDGVFPNGVQRLADGRYLWADSVAATIWVVDMAERSASVWLRHPLLAPVEGAWMPGLNGLKVFGNTLYMTNTAQTSIVTVAMEDSRPAGEPSVLTNKVGGDDFAIDANGSIYVTTHPFDTVLRLDRDGTVTRVAGPEQGVRGCTACRFGRRPGDETGLYVVTDGGLFNPMSGGLQPATLVRLETGVAGAPAL